jgi:hypothetical protein
MDFSTQVPNPPEELQDIGLTLISRAFSWVTPYT